MLSDIRVYLEALGEVARTVPVKIWGTALLGTAIFSGWAGWYARKLATARKVQSTTLPNPSHDRIEALIKALERNDEDIWRLHKGQVPDAELNRLHGSAIRIVTLANLKGGVGKTTLAANLAAYFAEAGRRVLLIDFDYQGSLSAAVLGSVGRKEAYSESDKLLSGELRAPDLIHPARNLGPTLPGLSIVPADLELNRQEFRLLLRWLLKPEQHDDPRFALARVLAAPEILSTFQLVIIDTPPRLGLATINALCASTHVLVPTILDEASVANVGSLLRQMKTYFRQDLNRQIEVAGIIGTMTGSQPSLDETERRARRSAEERAQEAWGERAGGIDHIAQLAEWPSDAYVFRSWVSDTVRFSRDAGRTIAYLDTRNQNASTRSMIEAIGSELNERLRW